MMWVKMMSSLALVTAAFGSTCPAKVSKTFDVTNEDFGGTCQVYKRGQAPCVDTPLGEGIGWLVVLGFGVLFTVVTVILSRYEYKILGTAASSEQFNTAGRNIGPGVTAAVIVSQWTWAATLLMSSNMGYTVGVSGPFWYASGATIQILLFAILAIQVKRRCSHMHTFLEIVKARFGTGVHLSMMFFALLTNIIVTSMLLLGGAWTIEDLTGVNKLFAAFLIPLVSCWIYTMFGGLRATFLASYIHTTVIFVMLIVFSFAVYTGTGDHNLWGSASNVHKALQGATEFAFKDATFTEQYITNFNVTNSQYNGGKVFHGLGAIMENDGLCYKKDGAGKWAATDKSCRYQKRGKDESCCPNLNKQLIGSTYCRAAENSDCITVGDKTHFESKDCNVAAGETCVTSYVTMGSTIGLIFGITNIVGNFGTVFMDQSYWQSAVAAKPKSAVMGFLIGGMIWFAVPFCMATSNGLAGRALTLLPNINGKPGYDYISMSASAGGLTPARVLTQILGSFGSFILLLQLFMAITSTGSAEIIAVSSILTYDVYYEYLNPELKTRREKLRNIFYTEVSKIVGGGDAADAEALRLQTADKEIPLDNLQNVVDRLIAAAFFEKEPDQVEMQKLREQVSIFSSGKNNILAKELYSALNKAVASNNIEGRILLRVSKFFTGIFALFMGFIAVFLLASPVDSLGHVYMSMGVLVGSAVGPAALTILMEKANGLFIALGAWGGLIMGLLGWIIQAAVEFDKVGYGTMMSDWPWVVGNLCAICGGTLIALVGSLVMPPKEKFEWKMLNDRIPLVDDVEPPKDEMETEEKLTGQVKIAVIASILLTLVLLVLWPIPLHLAGGVFSEGGFTTWVVIQFLWAIIGGAVIIILPGYELIRSFLGKDKRRAKKAEVDISIKVVNAASCP